MTNISVNVDEDLLSLLDQLITHGVIKNRSEAIRGGIYDFLQEKLGIHSAKDLRDYLNQRKKRSFQSGVEVIKEIRAEE